jgi:Flp pilus assembly protein TadG
MNKLLSAIKSFLRPGEGECGSAAVEFGIIAPILVLITFAILKFSLVLFEQHRATEARRSRISRRWRRGPT